MARTPTKRTKTTQAASADPALAAMDAITADLLAQAQDRAQRLRTAAEQYAAGTQLRADAAALDGRGADEQDTAIARMADDLEPAKVAELLGIATRTVTEAVRRHRSPDGKDRPAGTGPDPAGEASPTTPAGSTGPAEDTGRVDDDVTTTAFDPPAATHDIGGDLVDAGVSGPIV
jgi:hypothetical protein